MNPIEWLIVGAAWKAWNGPCWHLTVEELSAVALVIAEASRRG